MKAEEPADRVTRAAARAAEQTPGVAFLQPRLAGLVRGSAWPYLGRAAARDARTGGVRAQRRGASGADWRLELHLAVREGHRALDVTRAVRSAVTEAVRTELAADAGRVSVAVTVVDIA